MDWRMATQVGIGKLMVSMTFLLASLGNNFAAWAQQPDNGQHVSFQTGDVNLDFSRIYVHAFKTGLGHEHAVEGKLKNGKLFLAEGNSEGTLVFDIASFDADGSKARMYVGLKGETDESTRRQVNENLLSADVLDVKRFPTAQFRIANVSQTKEGWVMDGEFLLRGRTQRITVPVTVENVKGWNHVRGKFRIKQTDYGIKPYTKAFGAVGVADELLVYGDLFVAP
ncbi:MAG: YceI family protein [Planctomycetales bacterium]|nr:YceI family protein [Planctomycetales bacterium]